MPSNYNYKSQQVMKFLKTGQWLTEWLKMCIKNRTMTHWMTENIYIKQDDDSLNDWKCTLKQNDDSLNDIKMYIKAGRWLTEWLKMYIKIAPKR
jgi:hypothetical protein